GADQGPDGERQESADPRPDRGRDEERREPERPQQQETAAAPLDPRAPPGAADRGDVQEVEHREGHGGDVGQPDEPARERVELAEPGRWRERTAERPEP